MPRVHDPLGAIVIGIAPQLPVPLSVYSGSDEVTLETDAECVAPVLLIVTVLVAL